MTPKRGPAHPAIFPFSRIRKVAPLALATMASQSLVVVLAPTMVEVSRDFEVSVGVVGQARTVTAATAIVTSIALTAVIDRLGIRPLLVAGAVLGVAGSAATAAAPSLAAFLAAQVLTGAGLAGLLSAGFAGVAAFSESERAWAMGQVVAAQALAWIVVSPITGVLTEAFSWRATYAIPTGIALAALIASRSAPAISAADAPGLRVGPWKVLADRSARRWVVAELAGYISWAANLTFLGAFLIQWYGISESLAGAVLGLGAAAFFASSTRSTSVARHFPRRDLAAVASVGTGIFVVLQFMFAPALWVTAVLFCVVGVCAGVRNPASGAFGLAQLPHQPGVMMSGRTAVVQAGYLLGALLGGAVLAAATYGALGALLALGMFTSAALMMRVGRMNSSTAAGGVHDR